MSEPIGCLREWGSEAIGREIGLENFEQGKNLGGKKRNCVPKDIIMYMYTYLQAGTYNVYAYLNTYIKHISNAVGKLYV